MAESQRRKGYATAALDALSDWAFENMSGLHRLTVYIEPWNTGSLSAAQRAGFEKEALLKAWELIGNEPRDMLVLARFRLPQAAT